MLISLRTKLVYLLVITAVVPLFAGLFFLLVEGRLVKQHEIGGQYKAMAEARSATLKASLHENVALAVTVARSPFCLDVARDFSENVPLDSQHAMQVDQQWAAGEKTDELNQAMYGNSSYALRRILQASHRSEMFITDRHGRVVICSQPTSDYLQADETWWRETFNNGQPQIYVSPLNFDHSSGIWSIDICAPILDDQGNFHGVCKTVVDMHRWVIPVVSQKVNKEDKILFLDSIGNILYDGTGEPYYMKYDLREKELTNTAGCWHFSGGQLIALAPMELARQVEGLPLKSQRWMVAIQTPTAEALAVVHNLLLFIVVTGVVIIFMAFAIGYIISNRQIIRPLERLRKGAGELAAGKVGYRIEDTGKSFLSREIQQLLEEFNTMAQAVEKSRSELELAAELKSRFIRIAGHELKTPVAYIMAMADLLAAKTDDPALVKSAENIKHRTKRLDEIISGMLKLSASDDFNPESDLTLEEISTDELIHQVADAVKPFVDNRNQNLKIDLPDEPRNITVDRNKILDALLNLLSNAIKFTPDGGQVDLSLSYVDDEHFRIDIADQGKGIEQKDMNYIFEPFWGGGNILNHSSGDFGYEKRGPGLGLPVARHFVEIHGGSIEAQSSPDGCVFTIILPVGQPDQASD